MLYTSGFPFDSYLFLTTRQFDQWFTELFCMAFVLLVLSNSPGNITYFRVRSIDLVSE